MMWSTRIGAALFYGWIVNFLAFFVIGVSAGGDAFNGKVEDGRYFLGAKGNHFEVSPRHWWAARIHGFSVVAGLPIAIVGWWLSGTETEAPAKNGQKADGR